MKSIASYIDHTLLKPDATQDDIKKICEEAKKYSFASVCVNPYYVKLASEQLKNTDVKVCSVIGFPLGCIPKEVKAYEAEMAMKNGARELDMVINISALKNKNFTEVENDIKSVVNVAKGKALVKVILETCLLTDEEKICACELSLKAGADFVKTSTGFSTSGANTKDVKLMKKTVGNRASVKASGGIRDIEKAMEMIEAGADRIGASSSVKIANDDKNK